MFVLFMVVWVGSGRCGKAVNTSALVASDQHGLTMGDKLKDLASLET